MRLHAALGKPRFDDVARLQLRGRTDAFAIFQRDAVAAFQQQFGVLCMNALGKKLQTMTLVEHLSFQYRLNILRKNLEMALGFR